MKTHSMYVSIMQKAQVSNVSATCTAWHIGMHVNAAGAIPALVTRWVDYRDKTALANGEVPQKRTEQAVWGTRCISKQYGVPWPMLYACLPPLTFELPQVIQSWVKPQMSLSRYTIYMVFSHPSQPQRLAYLDCYFNLLQLTHFFLPLLFFGE